MNKKPFKSIIAKAVESDEESDEEYETLPFKKGKAPLNEKQSAKLGKIKKVESDSEEEVSKKHIAKVESESEEEVKPKKTAAKITKSKIAGK